MNKSLRVAGAVFGLIAGAFLLAWGADRLECDLDTGCWCYEVDFELWFLLGGGIMGAAAGAVSAVRPRWLGLGELWLGATLFSAVTGALLILSNDAPGYGFQWVSPSSFLAAPYAALSMHAYVQWRRRRRLAAGDPRGAS